MVPALDTHAVRALAIRSGVGRDTVARLVDPAIHYGPKLGESCLVLWGINYVSKLVWICRNPEELLCRPRCQENVSLEFVELSFVFMRP